MHWWESIESSNVFIPGFSNTLALSKVKQLNGEECFGFQWPSLRNTIRDGTTCGEAGPTPADTPRGKVLRELDPGHDGGLSWLTDSLFGWYLLFNLILSWGKWLNLGNKYFSRHFSKRSHPNHMYPQPPPSSRTVLVPWNYTVGSRVVGTRGTISIPCIYSQHSNK